MAKRLHPFIKRQRATQKTVDACKGKAFVEWQNDCVKLVERHARNMGKPIKIPKYHDAKSAADALRSLGVKSLAEALDKRFTRIDPHQVLMADIVELPGANGFSGLTVAVGNGRVLGFHEDIATCDILQPLIISGAWRID
jgi:hypothetical protein